MNDPTELPVRENASPHFRPTREEGPVSHHTHREEGPVSHHAHRTSREEQFTSPTNAYTSSRHGNSRHVESYSRDPQGHQGHLYQPPHPLPTHAMQHSYGSLQRDMNTSVNPPMSRRRSSESSDPPVERGGRNPYYHPGRSHLQGLHPRRTYSNERTFNSNSPPQREHAHTDHSLRATPPHPHRSAQVESYL